MKNKLFFLYVIFFSLSLNILSCSLLPNSSSSEKLSSENLLLTYDMSNVTFEDEIYEYDGHEKILEIKGKLPDGVSVEYINNKLTEVGQIEAIAIFKGDEINYYPIEEKRATLTIVEPSINYDDILIDGIKYCVSGSFASVKGFENINANIVIPDKIFVRGDEFVVSSIDDYAFYDCNELINIAIPSSIKNIGVNAFGNCCNLIDVIIPNSINQISDSMFFGCINLKSIHFSNSIKCIGQSAFANCDNLDEIYFGGTLTDWCKLEYLSELTAYTSKSKNLFLNETKLEGVVSIPDGITKINAFAFYGLNGISNLIFPDTVIEIERFAFAYCSDLTNVIIGKNIEVIGDYSFQYCNNLTDITFNNNVASIGVYAFSYSNINDVILPNSVEYVGYSAFYNCKNLENISLGDGLVILDSDVFLGCDKLKYNLIGGNQYLGNESNPYLLLIKANYLLTIFTTNEKTKIIYSSAFKDNELLEEVYISSNVTYVGKDAFRNCKKLLKISFTNNVVAFGSSSFSNCNSLDQIYFNGDLSSWCNINGLSSLMASGTANKTLYINNEKLCGDIALPSNIEKICDSAFRKCGYINSITFSSSITRICESAFSSNHNISYLIVPTSITTIDNFSFSDCSNLKNIFYLGNEKQWNDIIIKDGNDDLLNATRYYYSEDEPDINENKSSYDGNYWHYDSDGKTPIIWLYERK